MKKGIPGFNEIVQRGSRTPDFNSVVPQRGGKTPNFNKIVDPPEFSFPVLPGLGQLNAADAASKAAQGAAQVRASKIMAGKIMPE